ncbi:MAG: peptidoglycan-binding protein [Bacteroidaceae bacterium]|nr:peptidoglycan-binding protein [Bacteroidaceae bacterium]
MSKTVDERVVSMQFDNRHFEQNVKTTMSTLDKLKKSLKMDSAAKGFENISASAKKVDLSPINKGVENARSGFSAFEVMAVTALANITNSAVNAGKRIVKALTIDPITTGFSEYETKINAVQTIMSNTASKGTTMADVTRVLNELNLYADKTIYNFAEMTRNIGTFTAAGVGLEEAASAIQGIANLAAASGSTSQQASTAMYQLSQALAAGTVKLMDWNSVVNAGMGGEKFQLALKETAREHGIAVDEMIEKEGSFRESLKHGWITADVLNNTLRKFTVEGAKEYAASMGYSAEQTAALVKEAQSMEDAATKVKTFTQLWDTLKESAQSGWAQTWELIVGDFEEAKEFLTQLSDLFGGIINSFSDARNNLLGDALNSNWEKLTKRINDAGVETEDFTDKIRECAEANGVNVDDLVKQYGSLGNAFKAGAIDSKYLKEALTKIREVGTKTSNKLSVDVEKIKKTLRFGSTGEEVKVLQQALVDLGYSLDKFGVDGIIGSETTAAIKKFQESVGLVANGVVGEETLEALKKAGVTIEEIGDKSKLANLSIDDLSDSMTELGGREMLIKGLMDTVKGVVDVFKIFGSSWKKAFEPIITSTGLYKAIKSFSDFAAGLRTIDDATGEFTKRGKQLARIFDGIVAVLDVFASITGGLVKMGLKAVSSALGMVNVDILELVAMVGDALVAFRDWFEGNSVFAKSIEYTAKAIGFAITAIRELINAILEMPAVQSALRTVETEFNNTIASVREYLSGGLERIKEFIETVKSMDSVTLDDLETLLINFKENVINYFFDVDALYEKFVTAFTNARSSIETALQTAGDKLVWVKEKAAALAKFIKDKLPAAIAIGMGVMLIKAVGKIGNALELLSSPLELVETIGDAITRLSKARAFKDVSQGVLNLAFAVGILAASVALLTLVKPERLWSVVGALSALMGVLAALAGAVALIEKFGDFGKSSTAIVMLSGSLLLIAIALKTMNDLDVEKAKQSMIMLGAMAVTLAIVVGVLGKFVPKLSSGSLTFLALAGALKVMVDALIELDSAEFNNIDKSMGLMLGIILSLGLIAKACGSINIGSAFGIIAIAIGLKMLVSIIEDIGELDAGKLTNNIDALVVVFGSFAALMIASKFAGKNAAKAGAGILMISASMLLIIQAMKEMGKLDSSTVSKATDAISQLLLVFGAIVGLSYFAGKDAIKAGVMMLALSGAMVILAGVIHMLKDIPAVDLAKAVSAIAVLGILFGGLIYATKYEIPKGTTALLIELTVIIGLMALIIVGLSKLDPISAMSAAGSLSLLMGTFTGVLTAIGRNKVMTVKEIGKTALSLAALTGVTALLAQIIGKLASCNPSGVMTIAASLSVLLLTMAGVLTIISMNPVMTMAAIGKSSVALLALTGIVALLAQIIGALAKCEPKNALEIATALSILLLSMSAVCVILGGVGTVAIPALAGIGVLAALIVSIGALMIAIGALAEHYPGMERFLDTGIVMLEKIGTGIGAFVGGIVGGALGSMSSGLPAIGRNMSAFMDELQPFIDGISAMDPAAAEGAKTLAETILILTAADVLSGLTSWFTGGTSLVDFGKEIATFGPYMREYAESMSGVDTSVVESSANAANALAKLAKNLPSTGGKWQEWFGGKNLKTFGGQLVAFGTCLSNYSKSITENGGIDKDAITDSAEAAKGLADIASNLPSTGGKWQEWFGGKNLATFGSQLALFGRYLATYSRNITADGGIDSKAIAKSADAAKGLANVSSNLPSTGGKWQEWFGGKSLSTFGSQLELFGKSISKYSKTISGENAIDIDAINTSVTASKSLAQLANNLPSYHVFDGKSTPTEFGAEIEAFGKSIGAYCASLSGADMSSLSSSITQANRLVNMIKGMAGLDISGTSAFVTGLQTLAQAGISGFVNTFAASHAQASTAVTNFINASVKGITNRVAQFNAAGKLIMTNLVAGIRSNGAAVSSATANIVSGALTRITSRSSAFLTAGRALVTNLSIGMTSTSVTAANAITTIIDTTLTRIRAKSVEFNSTGQMLMIKFIAGIRSKDPGVSSAFSTITAGGLSKVRNYYTNFYDVGKYLAQGFAAGITADTWRAEAAAKAMAKKAKEAAEKELDENSPSKEFYKIGAFVAQGFALGIQGDTRKSTSAATNMASSAIDTVRGAISRIADAINGELDTQPTIRPILDLSNVEAGTGRLQAIFSSQQAMSVSASLNRNTHSDAQTEASTVKAGSTFQFTQINNSPKALSRNEIYRQTSNQFSAFERMVKA